jgi:hypothetical protein
MKVSELASCMIIAYPILQNLKMEEKISSETSDTSEQAARPYIREDITFQDICTLQDDKS